MTERGGEVGVLEESSSASTPAHPTLDLLLVSDIACIVDGVGNECGGSSCCIFGRFPAAMDQVGTQGAKVQVVQGEDAASAKRDHEIDHHEHGSKY